MDINSQERFLNLIKEIVGGEKQTWLAQKIGLSSAAVTRWFRGEISPEKMPISTLVKLAELKGWTIDELLKYLGLIEIQTSPKKINEVKGMIETLNLSEQYQISLWLTNLLSEDIDYALQNLKRSQKKLLVIDGNPDGRLERSKAYQRAYHLKPENFFLATSIEQIETYLRDNELDYVLIDIQSDEPKDLGMNAFHKFVKNKYAQHNCQVIVFSAYPFDDDEMAFYSQRCQQIQEFMLKPIDYRQAQKYFGDEEE